MTHKLTFLILALFALISGPGWGQTTYTMQSYSNNVITSDNNATWATTSACGGSELPYTLNSKRGAGFQANNTVTSSISVTNASKITVIASSNGNKTTTLAVKVGNTTFGNTVSVPQQNYQTLEFTAPNNTTASGTIEFTITRSSRTLWIGQVIVETASSTDPVITVNPTSIDLGTVNIDEEAATTFTVSQANLTNNISLSAENGILDTESIAADASTPTEVTYTITPSAAGEFSDIITISCDDLDNDIEINVSGNAIDPSQFVTYEKVSSVDDLIAGKHYIIVGKKNETYYAMGSQKNNNRDAVEIEATETMVQVPASTSLQEFTISGDPTNNYTFYELGLGYLYAAGANSNNYLKTETDLDEDGKGKWSVTFNENGEAIIISEAKNCSRNTIRFNASNNPPIFSCYSSGSQQPVYLYMKENDINNNIYSDTYIDGDISNCLFFSVGKGAALTVTGTIDANIMMFSIVDGSQLIYDNDIQNGTIGNRFRKYDDNEAGQRTGWNLVSVPIKNYNLSPGISISGDYDLYSYYEPTHFWINKKDATNPYFQTAIGTGYLFAVPSSNTQARFGGMGTLQGSGQNLSFPLSYTETLESGKPNVLKGFNLVGNPFTCNAYVNMDYLVLDETGSNFVNPTSPIKPGDAILVQATAEGQKITFTRNAPTEPENRLDISVSQNRGSIIDNARIRFGGSHAMNKFYLNENGTRVYIPQNDEEFAVVSTSSTNGELPVNFKAAKNGTYTITVNAENVDAEYLHLIDNKTGMDVDLLASTGSASYTFEAKTSDYASRFKLVFGVNNADSTGSASNFAYMSDGNLVIDNIEGQATLQIIDELGRVISTETVNGSYNKTLNLKAGLYILNLNGMTQKIVVK